MDVDLISNRTNFWEMYRMIAGCGVFGLMCLIFGIGLGRQLMVQLESETSISTVERREMVIIGSGIGLAICSLALIAIGSAIRSIWHQKFAPAIDFQSSPSRG